uniref:uncharacterized protein LOC122610796 n=1 Tax=Erigeron canadensis TaxID=72917 RepID=UPI001CB9BE8E|nr:uncharacterized protein LOC122610796 [Erigeron canadensis]
MYVTRSVSHYKSNPEDLYLTPEGPNSGFLVIQDKESETYSWFGLWKNKYLPGLPFPQNKTLTTRYCVNHQYVCYNDVVFIPVLNQPLSANRYYAIKSHGSHKGEAYECSKEENMASCWFFNCVRDVKPRPLDPKDVYQQFEIVPCNSICKFNCSFYAKSLANDGYPPCFLRRKTWEIYSKTPKNYELREAKGIDDAFRSRLPDMDFPISTKSSKPVVVGKWYCPFMFIKEGKLSDQMKKSIYYEMTLEQNWDRIFEQENKTNEGNVVSMKASFRSEAVFIGESQKEGIWDGKNVVDGAVWFTPLEGDIEKKVSVGLNIEIIERMKWEEEKVGWFDGGEKRMEKVKREDTYEGGGVWKRFGCYVLVERFMLKRMDGSLVLAYQFGHAHQIKSIFE